MVHCNNKIDQSVGRWLRGLISSYEWSYREIGLARFRHSTDETCCSLPIASLATINNTYRHPQQVQAPTWTDYHQCGTWKQVSSSSSIRHRRADCSHRDHHWNRAYWTNSQETTFILSSRWFPCKSHDYFGDDDVAISFPPAINYSQFIDQTPPSVGLFPPPRSSKWTLELISISGNWMLNILALTLSGHWATIKIPAFSAIR